MTVFYYIILKAINDYKAMLRRILPATECTDKIRALGIKRTHIKNANEVKLYKIGLKIVEDLEQNMSAAQRERSVNFYYGEEKFLHYIKKLLTEYSIENGKVVNASQKSSCALVTAIQLIDKAKEKLTDEIAQQIHQCGRVIAKYGNKEQRKILSKIISNDQPRHMNFLFRQMQNFVVCPEE